jgi:hypothetical protein
VETGVTTCPGDHAPTKPADHSSLAGGGDADGTVTVATWNVGMPSRSVLADAIDRLLADSPDILCLTNAAPSCWPDHAHVATSQIDPRMIRQRERVGWWYEAGGTTLAPLSPYVALLSRWPLEEIDTWGNERLTPGYFVAATCRTPYGRLRLIGVRFPERDWWTGPDYTHWPDVPIVPADRAPWEECLAFIQGLARVLDT